MKLTPFAVAVAAAFSMSAIAADEKQKDAQSQGSQSSQQASSQSPEMVKQAQEKLSAAGHDAGEPDGIMGPKTQSALKEFQNSKGLQASGELDQKTMAALGMSGGSSSAGASSDKSGSASAGGSSEKPSEKSK